jgi:hypothetical protein
LVRHALVAGKATFQLLGVFAELERSIITERINAGIARAEAAGKHCGRPRIDPALEKRIQTYLASPWLWGCGDAVVASVPTGASGAGRQGRSRVL